MNSLDKLFEKYLQNKCSNEEINLLLDYFELDSNKQKLKSAIYFHLCKNERFITTNNNSLKKVDTFLEQTVFKPKQQISYKTLLKYAAVVFISISSIIYISYNRAKFSNKNNTLYSTPATLGNITLKLASGEKINLNKNLALLPADIKATADKIEYDHSSKTSSEINELTTGPGAKYEIVLSDGTKVLLNASSTLIYPTHFSSKIREVEIIGEAYFEVAHQLNNSKKVPFVVKSKNHNIEVLGTKFNVAAYEDDNSQTTTLVSGSVSVTSNTNNEKFILLPGHHAVTLNTGATNIAAVNSETAISWTNNNFLFEDILLKDILKQVSRWYGINVDYNTIPNTRYTLLLSKSVTLSTVLKYLEDAGKIKFTIKDNTIYAKDKEPMKIK